MKCKKYLISSIFFFVYNFTYSQCYIQYTYDSSGNRIKREYIGGCAKPGSAGELEAVMLDTLQLVSTELRTEIMRQDVEGQIRIYPNPTSGLVFIQLASYEAEWTYILRSISGQLIRRGYIGEGEVTIDISGLPAADYKFNIYDAKGKILYHTSIIKQ